jgi:hypothetical protein
MQYISQFLRACGSYQDIAENKDATELWVLKLKLKIEITSFVIKFHSLLTLSISRCRSGYEADLIISVVSFISSSMG